MTLVACGPHSGKNDGEADPNCCRCQSVTAMCEGPEARTSDHATRYYMAEITRLTKRVVELEGRLQQAELIVRAARPIVDAGPPLAVENLRAALWMWDWRKLEPR